MADMSDITKTTILLAEDDENDVMLIRRAFNKSHVVNPIACVSNGEEAVAYLAGEGRTVRAAFLDETLAWLASSTEAERRARLLEPDRSEVLAAGVLILREILRKYDLREIRPCGRDLLTGAALAAAELPAPEDGGAPPGAYTCC